MIHTQEGITRRSSGFNLLLHPRARPQVNAWGDQPTLEMVRLIVEWGGFCFLDKDKRGDFKVRNLLLFDGLSYVEV